MDNGDVLGVFHDALDRIRNVEHEACGELALGLAGIDETRSVRDELAAEHHGRHVAVEHRLGRRVLFRTRNVADDAADDVCPSLKGFAVFVLNGVSLGDDLLGVKPQRASLNARCRSRCSVSVRDNAPSAGLNGCAHSPFLLLT